MLNLLMSVSQKLSRGAEGGPLGKPNTCIGRGFKSKTPDPIEHLKKNHGNRFTVGGWVGF